VITLGVDIGSLTGKALVLGDDGIMGWDIVPTGPDSVETGTAVTRRALDKAGRTLEEMELVVATGYGRIVLPFAGKNISEISCHAKGAAWLFPTARTILDMGGQDCKAIRCAEGGKVASFVMNDKCAAGAGRSMGIIAELLDVPLAEVGELSLRAEREAPVSSTCVVFARSEILAHLRRGVPRTELLAGACAALCSRVGGLLRRVGMAPDFVISGGIAKNLGVVRRLETLFGLEAKICFEPQIVGALGAAIFAREVAAKRRGVSAAAGG
jgi:predicted CoA-substrate-specific enzyme activase